VFRLSSRKEGGCVESGLTAGKVQTVLGLVEPECLGFTSTHEHILADMSLYFVEPESAGERGMAREPLGLSNLAWARAHRFSHLDNMRLDSRQLAIDEVGRFKRAGGGTIVEMSSRGLGRDPVGLAQVARATGVNIVMGCSYYVGLSHPAALEQMSEDDIAQEIVAEMVEGVSWSGVRPGVIGEVGLSGLAPEREEKVLRASVLAQRRTGAPLVVHPMFGDEGVTRVLEILIEGGALLSKTLICHVDVFDYSLGTCRVLLEAGCYVGIDNFGNLGYPHHYLGQVVNLTGDLERLKKVRDIMGLGYSDRILLGGDTVFKDQLFSFGGFGYGHLIENVAPLMRACGFTCAEVQQFFYDNPSRFLAFADSAV